MGAGSEVLVVEPTALTSLLVKPGGSALAETLERSLRAAGARVTTVTNPYDVLVEVARAEGPFRHILLGVDYFGRDEFRLLPILRREWPEMVLVAYHSPGFEYKGELAELVGADLVLTGPDDISRFLEALSPASPATERSAAPRRAEAPHKVSAEAFFAKPSGRADTTTAPKPPAPQTADAAKPKGEEPIRLTEEELRVLLGEEDEP